ncbi:MAG TPA: DUF3108 domain-containing protein [Kofleriaceae bacterium]|nr:DUF3108 domain-containing protein [Kofleriaceae bacterium]
MHRARLIAIGLLGGLTGATACGNPSGESGPGPANPAVAAAPARSAADGKLRDGPPLATPGEHMQYRLSLQGVDLASYDLVIGDITELGDRRAIVVQGHARTTGFAAFIATIDDRFTSWVDVATGRPLRFQTDEYASGSKTDIEHAVIDLAGRTGDVVPVTFHVNDTPPRPEPQTVSQPVVWDYNAFLLALRTWEGAPGSALAMEVFRSRWMWHVDVKIHGKEKLVTELGELPALRIEGRTYKLDRKGARVRDSAERSFTMWVSDDDGRVPLQIKATTDYGDLKMQIVDYQPGTGKRLRDASR